MRFNELTQDDKNLIRASYNRGVSRDETQALLAATLGTSKRAIRRWAKDLGIVSDETSNDFKVMVYDIETSRVTAKVWWTGKQ